MTEADEGAEVIALPTAHPANVHRNHQEAEAEELAVRRAPGLPRSETCRHRRTRVDPDARTLTCRDCEVPVDPFAVLASLADQGERLVAQRARLRFDVKHLSEQKLDLERQERNTKARLRSARKRCRAVDGAALAAAVEAEREMITYSHQERVERIVEAYVGAFEGAA